MQENLKKKLKFITILEFLSQNCESKLGENFCKELLPNNNINKVKKLLSETTEGVKLIHLKGTPPLFGIKDIFVYLKKASKGMILEPQMLLDISTNLIISKKLKKYFNISENISLINNERDNSDLPILQNIFLDLYTNENIEKKITSTILHGGLIADTASQTLFEIRKKIKDLENKIKEKLNIIIHSSSQQKYLQEPIISIKNNRYVVPVKQEYKNKIPGLVHDTSASGSTLFIEPMFVVEMNNEIKELKKKEELEIEIILKALTELVVNQILELEHLTYNLGKLDFIFAKAKLSISMDATEPKLNTNGYINLKKARHPLISKEIVVPINIWCGKDFNTLVITGPNTGGKTVTLKTVGLLTLMAQSGLHIPVDYDSTINIFKNIFIDIGDEQSIEQNLSTFSSHMMNIINILNNTEPNSLILLDELGSGTDPIEGSALAMSILEFLHQKPIITLATTHYSEIKQFALKTKGIENASCEFDIQTLKPTYKLLIGIPGKSNAFAISQKLGLSKEILNKAKTFIDENSMQFEDIIASAHQNKIKTQKHLEKIEKDKLEIETLKNTLTTEKQQFELKKQDVLMKAKREASLIIEKAKTEAKETLKEIRNLVNEKELSNVDKKAEKLKQNLNSVTKTIPTIKENLTPIQNENYVFKIGEYVKIPSLDTEGTILTLADNKNNLQVQVGTIKLTLKQNQLIPTNKPTQTNKIQINKNISTRDKNFSTEITVRHQTLEEALMNVDKYLDNAILLNIKIVTIIHGKGTGTLRNGIHAFLKKHPQVSSFRLGQYGEGDSGVTIVELK